MVTPSAKREAVAHLKGTHEVSERRACRLINCDRMMVRYRSRRADDPSLRERLRALARERRRFGYRRLLIFLRREGFTVNHKRLFRIYRGGTPHGAQTGGPQKSPGEQKSPGDKGAHGGSEDARRSLVTGFRLRSTGLRATLSYPGDLR